MCQHVAGMINDGRVNHIGHAVVRFQGQTAWGVWLRINHWESSQGTPRTAPRWCPVTRGEAQIPQ